MVIYQLNLIYLFMLSYVRAIQRVERQFYSHLQSPRTLFFSTNTPSKNEVPCYATQTNLDSSNISALDVNRLKGNFNSNNTSKSGQLSPEAQRAYWAWTIIMKIRNAKLRTQIKTSLRDQILNLQPSTKQYLFSDVYKNQVMQMFSNGVKLNKFVFNQERIQNAKINDIFTFFPTYTVSYPIFGTIHNNCDNIVMGSFGIGKTISVICYSLLAKYVNNLKFLALAPWVPQEKRQFFKKQHQQLMAKQLIGNARKIWYWNVDGKINVAEKDVVQLALNQIDELNLPESLQEQLKTKATLKQFIKTLNDRFPQYRQQSIAIIDQINVITSYFRQFNSPNRQKIKQVDGIQQQKIDQYIKQRIKNGQRLMDLAKDYSLLGSNWFFNSSYYVERQLFEKVKISQLNVPRLRLDLNDHGDPLRIKLSYAQMLQTYYSKESAKMEFLQLFFFLLDLQTKNSDTITRQKIKHFKSQITLSNFKVKNYYRFLFARQYTKAKKHQIIGMLDYNPCNQLLKRTVLLVSEDFKDFSLKQTQLKLEKFIQKRDSAYLLSSIQKKQLLRLIHNEALLCKNRGSPSLQVSVQKLQILLRALTYRNYLKVNDILEKGSNTEIFPFSFNQNKTQVKFDWEPEQFLQITQDILFPIIREDKISLFQRWVLNTNGGARGIQGEKIIIWLMTYSKGMEMEVFQDANNQNPQKIYLPLNRLADFFPFNNQFKGNRELTARQIYKSLLSFENNLKDVITKAKIQPGESFYALPKITIQSFQKDSQTSKAIDFLIVKYIKEEQLFEINTFDVGIGASKNSYVAENLLKQLLRTVTAFGQIQSLQKSNSDSNKQKQKIKYIEPNPKDLNKYRVTHTIISPKIYCKNIKTIQPNILKIQYSPLQSIQFIDCSDKPNQDLFQEIRQIMIINANNKL